MSRSIAQSRGCRALRHWRALTVVRRQFTAKHERVLRLAAAARKRRLFVALRLVTAIRAEQGRLISANLARLAAVTRLVAILALRANVARRDRKRSRLLSALLHWERRSKTRVARGWLALLIHGKAKRALMHRGINHHRTRVLQSCMAAWLDMWQVCVGVWRAMSRHVGTGNVD